MIWLFRLWEKVVRHRSCGRKQNCGGRFTMWWIGADRSCYGTFRLVFQPDSLLTIARSASLNELNSSTIKCNAARPFRRCFNTFASFCDSSANGYVIIIECDRKRADTETSLMLGSIINGFRILADTTTTAKDLGHFGININTKYVSRCWLQATQTTQNIH